MTDGPLEDVQVLELGHIVAGPYASLILSDLGASVVKVEPPNRGDPMRVSGKAGQAIFNTLNRDKRGIELDLTAEEGHQAFLDLVQDADVFIENLGPGVMERFDLGWATLRDANPELIYVSIKGFGDGPYRDRPATDPIGQAMSGLMHMTGYPDGEPARAGTSVVDMVAGLNAAIAVLVALGDWGDGERGQRIRVPIFEGAVSLMGYWLAYEQMSDTEPMRRGASHPLYVPYDTYPTREGYVFIGAVSEYHWHTLTDVLGLSLPYETRDERVHNRERVDEAVADRTNEWEQVELVERLVDAGVPVAPVNDIGDVVGDSHLRDVGAFTNVADVFGGSGESGISVPLFPAWSSGFDITGGGDPPELGEDTDEILGSLGLTDEEIAAARGGRR